MTAQINYVESKLSERISKVETRLNDIEEELTSRIDNIRFWATGAVVAIVVGFIASHLFDGQKKKGRLR